jgi:hypothetical protein
MKKYLTCIIILLVEFKSFTQYKTSTDLTFNQIEPSNGPIAAILLPILFLIFLVFMLITLVKYFLDYRLKNKLTERGMSDQLSNYQSAQEKQNDAIKLAILFCGLGIGLTLTYFTAPIDLHSLAIMAFSLGLSYLAYFLYLRKNNN